MKVCEQHSGIIASEGYSKLCGQPDLESAGRGGSGRIGRAARATDRVARLLPRGGTLPAPVWARRHLGLLALAWLHAPVILIFGLMAGEPSFHAVSEAGVVASLAGLSTLVRNRRRFSAVLAAVTLLTCSAILVHLSGGVIEVHFHFFVMVAVIALYEDWPPFLMAIGYVVVHHGVAGTLFPDGVYNHQAAVDHPWTWAAVHGFFIIAMSVAAIVSWRLNEAVRSAAVAGERKLAEAQRIAGLGSWEWDISSGRVSWSEELYRLFGRSPAGFTPSIEGFLDLVHPDDRPLAEAAIKRSTRTGEALEYDFRACLLDGQVRWLHSQLRVTRVAGRPVQMAGTVLDLTDRKRTEEQLERSQEVARLLQRVTAAANEAVSFEAAIHMALNEVCVYTGWPLGHLYEVSPDGSELVPTTIWYMEDDAKFDAFREGTEATRLVRDQGLPGKVLASGRPAWVTDITANAANPRYVHALASGVHAAFAFPVMVADEVVQVFEFFSTERKEPDASLLDVMHNVGIQLGRVAERWRAQQALTQQALHDSLTGLANRALFLDHVSHTLSRRSFQPGTAAVLFLDLDRFKVINDSLGHDAGDEVLVAVARRLEKVVRPSDTVARLGGDEFTIFCEEMRDEKDAVALAQRIIETLAVAIEVKGRELTVTPSVGITFVAGTETAEDLLRDADMAMYRAKQEGRARYALFDPQMQIAATQRLETASALGKAVKNGELRLHFQPQVALFDQGVVGVEALLRWQHPVKGLLLPSEFIPVAEESDLIIELGNWAVEEACRQATEWDVSAPSIHQLDVCVNVSARQLSSPDLVDVVTASLQRTGLDPARLCLEVTESVVMSNTDASFEALTGLKLLGVTLAVDDFGTGYSSLSYLQRLPVQVLKVDKSFVRGVDKDPSKAAIVRSVIELAHGLHLTVVAEGVETREEAETLIDLRCDVAQGYYFARPEPTSMRPLPRLATHSAAWHTRGSAGLAVRSQNCRPPWSRPQTTTALQAGILLVDGVASSVGATRTPRWWSWTKPPSRGQSHNRLSPLNSRLSPGTPTEQE